jgi:glutamyl-tRNA reductase
MHDIVLLGINHNTAPVELRECIAFSESQTVDALKQFGQHQDIREILVFSTCNRVEFLFVTNQKPKAIEAAKAFIAEKKSIPQADFKDALYIYEGNEAVRHVFRVAASLDSMMVGEPQILGQVKEAYNLSVRNKKSSVILNRLLHRAFFVAKRVRTETGIGDHAVSISYAAIELGRKIFGQLDDKKVLLIGAGEMAELAVEHLIRHRVAEVMIANRTFERGVALAKKFKGKAIRFEEIPSNLEIIDIIISSTGSPEYVITRDHVKKVMRRRRSRPLFFIDIAVPRDIDPDINRMSNTYVYDIDDLKSVIEENINDRKKEALKGERIVDEAVIRFQEWYDSLEVVPTIVALRNRLDTMAQAEIEKTMQTLKHLNDNDRQALKVMVNAFINKILHNPTQMLKNSDFHGNKSIYLDILRRLFKLDDP